MAGGVARLVGITADDGYRLLWTVHKQRIGNDGTDRYGLSLLENVYRGGDWSISYRAREYGVTAIQTVWPYGAQAVGNPIFAPSMSQAGLCDDTSLFTGILGMTVIAGTPAASNGPTTLVASHAIVADGQQMDTLFTSKLRELPVLLNLLPYAVSAGLSATPIWFSTS